MTTTMMRDPVLARLSHHDADLHHRVVEALLALGGESASATARYQGLPDDLMHAVASSSDASLRGRIAARTDCPVDLFDVLARDADSDVRRAVARNEATPAHLLIQLASDDDRWVRFDAYNNPAAPDEARAAASLLSSPDDLQRHPISAAEDPRTPSDELRRLALSTLGNPNEYRVRSSLAENPSLPDDLVPILVEAAGHRWEWRSLWSRGVDLQGMSSMWPSTAAFTDPQAPSWVLAALVAAGHPAGLLRTDLPLADVSVEPAEGVVQLINGQLLTRALWRELALAGVVELVYWNDSLEGDHFFPTSPTLTLMEANTAAEYIVGGYSDSREWIETRDVLPHENLVRLAGQLWEDWSGVIDEYSDEDLDLFTMGAAAYEVDNHFDDSDPVVTITAKGKHALARLVTEGVIYPESDDYDTIVVVRDSALPAVGYEDTSVEQKRNLVAVIQGSRSNPMLSHWGISSHFLECIALHPGTPEDIRSMLAADEDVGVREAALAGKDGAQARVVASAPDAVRDQDTVSSGSAINTHVFSTLIPQGRFEEARIWLQQCIDLEAPYESWNARSNLGVLAFMTGQEDEARQQFAMVLASGDGPGFEAEEYLERIDDGETPERTPRLEYSEEWRNLPPQMAPAGSDQRSQYLRFIRLMSEPDNGPTFREDWLADPGGFISSFLDGVFENEDVVESGLERETAAKAVADYFEHVLLELPTPHEAGQLGAVRLAAGDRDGAEAFLRRAASVGDSQAARMLGTLLMSAGKERQGQAWLNVADIQGA